MPDPRLVSIRTDPESTHRDRRRRASGASSRFALALAALLALPILGACRCGDSTPSATREHRNALDTALHSPAADEVTDAAAPAPEPEPVIDAPPRPAPAPAVLLLEPPAAADPARSHVLYCALAAPDGARLELASGEPCLAAIGEAVQAVGAPGEARDLGAAAVGTGALPCAELPPGDAHLSLAGDAEAPVALAAQRVLPLEAGAISELEAMLLALHPPATTPMTVHQVLEFARGPSDGRAPARLYVVEAQRTDETGPLSALLLRPGASRADDGALASPAPIIPLHAWPTPGLRVVALADLDRDGASELILHDAASARWLVETVPAAGGVLRIADVGCAP